jgi:predicted transcriptional regulator
LATEIMAAFVANNSVPRAELPALFEGLHAALKRLADGGEVSSPVDIEKPAPAVSIRKSVTPDYLICLDDGLKFKSLRRHLATLGMTPEQYRLKWDLPSTYPMVAPNYSAERSALAKGMGFGLRGKSVAVPASGESKVSAAPSESALTINAVEPEPASVAKAKSKVVAAPQGATAKRKPGRPRKATA